VHLLLVVPAGLKVANKRGHVERLTDIVVTTNVHMPLSFFISPWPACFWADRVDANAADKEVSVSAAPQFSLIMETATAPECAHCGYVKQSIQQQQVSFLLQGTLAAAQARAAISAGLLPLRAGAECTQQHHQDAYQRSRMPFCLLCAFTRYLVYTDVWIWRLVFASSILTESD